MKSKQYTIRGISESLDEALRKEATASRTSLNTLLIEKLSQSCRLGNGEKVNHDFDEWVGCLPPDPELEAALKDQRTIDPTDWPELSNTSAQ